MTREEAHEVAYNELGFCGCGEPEQVLKLIKLVLTVIDYGHCDYSVHPELPAHFSYEQRDKFFKWLLPTSAIFYFVLYQLDNAGLTEHGSSVGGCWLTDKGRAFLNALREFGEEAIEDPNNEQ